MRGNILRLNKLEKIGIVGPGLLGGSIGLALKSHNIPAAIIGIGHRSNSLDRAVEIHAIDQGSLNLADLAGCRLVILATPISLIKTTLEQIGEYLEPGSVVTDVGSTKRLICRWAGGLARKKIHFVGSHPIAGSEKRGIDFARPDLFEGRNCFITSTRGCTSSAVDLVRELWSILGMQVIEISARRHDQLLAAVSHLPHIIAAGLVNACTEDQLKFTGTGFLDTTRIASGEVNLWHDIIVSNSDFIAAAMNRFAGRIEKLAKAIKTKDSKKISRFLTEAKTKRDRLIQFKYEHKQIEP